MERATATALGVASARACVLSLALALAATCSKPRSVAAPAAPGAVEGRVIGRDVPADTQVNVLLLGAGGAVVARATSRAGGSFRFAKVPPGSYHLTADASGMGAASFAVLVQPGEDVRTVVHLKEPAGLEGVVTDRRGRPVPEALVLVWRAGGIAQKEREAKTDEHGRFAVSRLSTASVTVFVQAPGIGSVKLDGVGLPSRPLRVMLEGEGRTVQGAVVNAREPLEHIAVRIGGPGLRQMRSTGVDAHGRFTFHGLGAGEYSVRAGGVAQASPTQPVLVEQSDVTNVALPLEPGEVISGRVTDGKGQALAASQVVVQAVPPDGCPESIATDVVGYFSTVALRRGRYQVIARAAGYVGQEPQTVAINARPAPLTLRLERGGRLTGRILLPDGAPAEGAEIALLSPAQPRFPRDRVPVVAGNLPLAAEAAALGTQVLPHVMGVRGATTDARGAFALAELRPGSYGLRITHAAAAPLEVPPRTLPEGGQLEFGPLQLPASSASPVPAAPGPTITPALPPGNRVVSGSVRDPKGRGLTGVALTVRPADPQAVPVSSATTGPSGAFTLSRLPAVPLFVRAQHADFGLLTQQLAPTDKTITLRFPNPGGIEGEIVDGNGRFLSGGSVTLVGPEGIAGPPVQMSGAGFRVLGVPPGSWTLKAQVPGFAPAETTVEVAPAEAPRIATVKGVRLQVRAK